METQDARHADGQGQRRLWVGIETTQAGGWRISLTSGGPVVVDSVRCSSHPMVALGFAATYLQEGHQVRNADRLEELVARAFAAIQGDQVGADSRPSVEDMARLEATDWGVIQSN